MLQHCISLVGIKLQLHGVLPLPLLHPMMMMAPLHYSNLTLFNDNFNS